MSGAMLTMLGALGAELLLVVLVLLTVAWFRNRAARRRDVQAIQKLVGRVKSRKTDREKAIAGFLEQRTGLSGEALDEAKATLLSAELVLLHRFASIYSERDAGSVACLDDDLIAALQPYNELQIRPQSIAADAIDDAGSDAAAANAAELEALREENQRLSEQLQVGMETMGRMVNEYSAMFEGGAKDATAARAGVQAAAETLPEAPPVVALDGESDGEPGAAADDATASTAEGADLPGDELAQIAATETAAATDAKPSLKEAATDANAETPDESPAAASASAETDEATGDMAATDLQPSADTAAADREPQVASESDTEQASAGSDMVEVLGDEPDASGAVAAATEEGAVDQVEPVLGQPAAEDNAVELDIETEIPTAYRMGEEHSEAEALSDALDAAETAKAIADQGADEPAAEVSTSPTAEEDAGATGSATDGAEDPDTVLPNAQAGS